MIVCWAMMREENFHSTIARFGLLLLSPEKGFSRHAMEMLKMAWFGCFWWHTTVMDVPLLDVWEVGWSNEEERDDIKSWSIFSLTNDIMTCLVYSQAQAIRISFNDRCSRFTITLIIIISCKWNTLYQSEASVYQIQWLHYQCMFLWCLLE